MKLINKYIVGLLLSVTALMSNSAPFSNGGFDDNPSSSDYLQLEIGSERIAPWQITKGNIELIGGYWQHDSGKNSIDLIGTSTNIGEISQTFDTEQGKRYKVKFSLSGNPYCSSPKIKYLDVRVLNSNIEPLIYAYDISEHKNSLSNMKWQQKEFTFVANEDSATIIFNGSHDPAMISNCGPALDSVSVTLMDESDECEECCKRCNCN